MENGNGPRKSKNGSPEYQPLKLATPSDTQLLCPIRYVYDYLSLQIKWLKPQPISLNRLFADSEKCMSDLVHHQAGQRHSIRLHTEASKLPLHTGLEKFRQNIHWRVNEEATKELLELFAHDRQCSEVVLGDKRSMATLAEEQLESAVIHTYSRFSVYMFAEADESRIQLLAQSVILIFAFDDMWESASPKTINKFRGDFVSRLQGSLPITPKDTPLERRLDAIRNGLIVGDEQEGNGGAEILQTLIDFCYHAEPPREAFGSVRDYLDYRWEDIANRFTWACSKFSIRSSVSQESPNLHRILRHLGDHISIVNDIASYEKEKQRFETGKAKSMISLVHVIMKVERVKAEVAKSMAYAWQLCTENEILGDLEELKSQNELSLEDWRFIDACLLAASGNLLTSVVISRYGGEDTRIN